MKAVHFGWKTEPSRRISGQIAWDGGQNQKYDGGVENNTLKGNILKDNTLKDNAPKDVPEDAPEDNISYFTNRSPIRPRSRSTDKTVTLTC